MLQVGRESSDGGCDRTSSVVSSVQFGVYWVSNTGIGGGAMTSDSIRIATSDNHSPAWREMKYYRSKATNTCRSGASFIISCCQAMLRSPQSLMNDGHGQPTRSSTNEE